MEETTYRDGNSQGKEKKEEQVISLGPQVAERENVFGVCHIFASFNNTFVHDVAQRCKELGTTALHNKFRATKGNRTKTPEPGAQSALRVLIRSGMKVGQIKDVTPIPSDSTRRKGEDPAEGRAIGEHLKEEMGRRQGKNSSNNLKNNMKTPDHSDLTTEGLEHPIPEEVENSVIMKAIESLKQGMNNSLKEIEEKYNKEMEEMSKEMEEKYSKKFEEMSKFVNDTLGNQEKTIKQVMESVQELKTEMEAVKKTQTEGRLDMENLEKLNKKVNVPHYCLASKNHAVHIGYFCSKALMPLGRAGISQHGGDPDKMEPIPYIGNRPCFGRVTLG
ncbi:hypothetical protein U0070_011846 [Myodes glareolus]|uniref:Uncharacterized protein n=1 Tax=Myodes glareolus TaxID=447135 RepID=A0AAW0JZP8_MYOGA